eukprot:gnl/TRDRNA2_/TRDRNA2_59671_c0_seq1.p1 gnl/TRDRNA2_/TRDRNA2_59671_c0~~gnl/TRDRNA2_/TRDRNA2_59671_c0_seq1.p1  ORF type:complete len:361 (-),score=45.89 gnl/TRDRNA2_/TRDRNA2_59671_c0_seq1:191-1273(-)
MQLPCLTGPSIVHAPGLVGCTDVIVLCRHTPGVRMEFDFDIGRALGVSQSADAGPIVARVDDAALQHPRWGAGLREVLDKVGERSKRAQGLGKAVTSGFGSLGSFRVYLISEGKTVLGLIKVGVKKLYVARGPDSGLVEINPLCVLDFYVVEGRQRGGLGHRLFKIMLAREGATAERLGYDAPSKKLLSFLQKHFNLRRFHPQSNHYVVFDNYWTASSASRSRSNPCQGSAGAAKLPPRPATPPAPPVTSTEANVVSSKPPRVPSRDPPCSQAAEVATAVTRPALSHNAAAGARGRGGGARSASPLTLAGRSALDSSRGQAPPPLPPSGKSGGGRGKDVGYARANACNGLVQAMSQGLRL